MSSATRLRRSFLMIRRSITISMSCRLFLSRSPTSSKSLNSPSTRKRSKPSFLILQNPIGHGGRGISDDRLMVMGAIRHANPRETKPEEIVNLRDGSDGRPRVMRGRLLIDGYRWGKSFDRIDIGFIDSAKELPGVRAQRFDVTPLAFGINRVKSQGGLATAREAGKDGEGFFGDIDIDVFQIIFAGSLYENPVFRTFRVIHCPSIIAKRKEVFH